MKKTHLSTSSIHQAFDPQEHRGAMAVPLYLTSAYHFPTADYAAEVFALSRPGHIYTRLNNPTTDVLEGRLAEMDGGVGAVAFASGTAALFSTLLCLMRAGDHIVSSSSIYGGTHTMLAIRLPRLGMESTIVETEDPADFEKAIRPNTKAIFLEALPNPQLNLLDIEAIAGIAHRHGIPLIVDNTVATPALLRPIEYGADIVTYSLTKYMQGHGTTMGGAVVDSGRFDWRASGRFPEFTTPDPAYHGMVYADLGAGALAIKLRTEGLRDIGACLSPFAAFEILQGLETLELRMKRHSETALAFARYLQGHPQVEWVLYPGLESSRHYALAQKYLPKGQSGLMSFGIRGGYEAAKRFVDQVKIFRLVANIGDVKSIVTHPASTTHQQLSDQEKTAAGVFDNLIRVSVGLEDFDDLRADFEQAFEKAK